jgi:peptidoglycan/LPS O-acetylase OafA/YrhL
LRGIAITLVLLFHIWPEYFSFGYVGVDIFFVLSGYLITQIIVTKLQSDSFSFKEFYRNRIRRIFPALIIVLLITFLIGYLFLFPFELEQLGKHIKSSAFFYQNFRLIGETGYWDETAQLKPLLHFWSLSIEEQFYIFWPLLLFILRKLKSDLFLSLLIIFVLLIIVPQFLNIHPFYHSLSRFWELCFGGLIYASSRKFNSLKQINHYRWIIFSIFFIAVGLAYGNNAFSVIKTFILVLTTGLLILYISTKPNDQLLSTSPLVFLGLISFPLYLWHYVFMSYMHIFGLKVQNYGLWIILFSIFISYLTYRYVEIYARKQTSYKFAIVLFVIASVVCFMGQYISKHHGLPNRSHLIANYAFKKQFIRATATNETGIRLITKILGHKSSNNYIKATSDDLTKKFISVIGDSHAHTSYPGFAQEFKKQGYETLLIANSSCPPYIEGAMGKNINDAKQCEQKINDIYTTINKIPHLKKIIFVTRGSVYMYDIGYGVVDSGGKLLNYHFKDFFRRKASYNQKEKFFKVLEETFKQYNKKHQFDFYYLLENPELGFSPKNCMERPFGVFPLECRLKYKDYVSRTREYRTRVKQIGEKYPNITIMDPKDLYCDSLYCYAVKGGKMLYADDDHISINGSKIQAKYLMKHNSLCGK